MGQNTEIDGKCRGPLFDVRDGRSLLCFLGNFDNRIFE